MWYPIIIQDNIPASVLLHLLVFVFAYLLLRERQHHQAHEDLKRINRDLVRIVHCLTRERYTIEEQDLPSNLVVLDDYRHKFRRRQKP